MKRTVSHKQLRLIFYLFIVGMFIYSGIGISIYPLQDKETYLLSYVLFIVFFTIFGVVICNSKYLNISAENKAALSDIVNKQSWLVLMLSIIYIFTFIFPLIYPENALSNIFNFQNFANDFSTISFSERVLIKNNSLLNFIIGPLRILVTPFFYLLLFQLRYKPFRFIMIYSLPIYLKFVNNAYISRNEILFFLLFIFLYLWFQKIFDRKILALFSIIGIFFILPFFYDFTFLRTGDNVISEDKLDKIFLLLSEETSYVNLLHFAENSLDLKEKINFFSYILTSPIPNFLLFGLIKPIALSEIFTHIIIGLNYGDLGYYLLLPTVFGEGIMLFGVSFSWIYSFVVSFFYLTIGKIISDFKELEFMLIAFVLDIFRQIRGGSQFIYTSWIPCLVYFILFLIVVKRMNRVK
ncbi:hypothetical protein IGI78_002092 [Enterococcus sp. DIV1767]